MTGLKKYLLLFIMVFHAIFAFGSDNWIETFLENNFASKNFHYEIHRLSNTDMVFGYLFMPSSCLFYRAVIFVNEFPPQPLLYIYKNKVIAPSGNVIYENKDQINDFSGWSIEFSMNRIVFTLSLYGDNENTVIDTLTFWYNSRSGLFQLVESWWMEM